MKPGTLRLNDGTILSGYIPTSHEGSVAGEVVFTTGMTGYIESLTDPSYAGQILCFTYPLIGNYGVPPSERWESAKIHAVGVVVSDCCRAWSHFEATQGLMQWLEAQGVALITDVDTRALTKKLRSSGEMLGAITDGSEPTFSDPNARHLVEEVSPTKVTRHEKGGRPVVVAVDCGMKQNIMRLLQQLPIDIVHVPHNYDVTQLDYDGIFLSNGPGDPAKCAETVKILQKAMKKERPIFGICLGTQLMALAAGASTYKLPFGHRGQNQPCIEHATGRCFITSQNHGFAIDAASLPTDWKVTYSNLNDGSVEGIAHSSLPFCSVQFHPEAAPGPTDMQWLFDQFYDMVKGA